MTEQPTILIVDDTETARDTLEALLFREQYTLLFAENGQEALHILNSQAVDVVLLDIMMPGMSGFDVCEQIRATPNLAEIPVIMVTALDDRQSKLRGIEVGADEFLTKPFDTTELRMRLRTILKLNRYRRLAVERERLTWVVDKSEDGYILLDDDDKILYANPKAQTQFFDELLLGQPFLTIAQHHYLQEPKELWAAWPHLSAEENEAYLVCPETNNSQATWLKVEVLVAQAGQAEHSRLIRLQDVTDRIITHRIKWAFHEHISHKIKTPLSHLAMSLTFLQNGYQVMTDEERLESLNMAYQGANRLRDGVDDIFRYLAIAANEYPGQNYCLAERFQTLIQQIMSQFDGSATLSLVEIPTDIYLCLSEEAISLILWELLENSKKFHAEQTPNITLTTLKGDNHVQLIVADNGVTLSSEQLLNMWLPYYQGDKYFTGEVTGIGLGLAMVASLIWGVGGQCKAYNRPDGPGVVIELLIPTILYDFTASFMDDEE